MSADAIALFDEANRLWFEAGASARALAMYEQAASAAPDDPVLAFQLARALWALGREAEGAATLRTAEAQSDALSEFGRSELARARARFAAAPPETPGIHPASLDADELEARRLPESAWLDVARAAEEREMYGLAAHGLMRGSSFSSLELEREEHAMRNEGSGAIASLEAMRRTPAPRRPGAAAHVRADEPAPRRPASARRPRPPGHTPAAPAIQLAVAPAVSGIGDDVLLDVQLRNPGDEPLAVNGRLLVNQPGAPPGYGEITLSVEGPPGYENNTSFAVRAGPPGPGNFTVLEPGETIRSQYRIGDYASLHLPGAYRIWVTYHNDIPQAVGDRPAFVGAVSSYAVAIERQAHDVNS